MSNSKQAAGGRRLMSNRETAEYLRISTRHLWTITNSGQLPHIKLGKSVRYDPVDVDAYIERCKSGRLGN